jgi:hypothetical protein
VAQKQLYGNYNMSIRTHRLCVVAAVCLAFSLAAPHAAQALVLDWNSVAWAPNTFSHSYDLTGDTVNDITVAITSKQANIWDNDPTSGTLTPALTQTLTGGIAGQNSLMLAADLKTQSDVTVHISFTGGSGFMLGAANVSFTIFDIDVTTNSDVISGIYGIAPDGSQVAATITNVGSAATLTGTGLSQTLTGNSASADTSGNGNATISFGSTLIYDVFLTFSNTSGAPRYQDIAFGDISFTPVPEINPAVASMVSCLVATGLMALVHRRAKLKARRLGTPQA